MEVIAYNPHQVLFSNTPMVIRDKSREQKMILDFLKTREVSSSKLTSAICLLS